VCPAPEARPNGAPITAPSAKPTTAKTPTQFSSAPSRWPIDVKGATGGAFGQAGVASTAPEASGAGSTAVRSVPVTQIQAALDQVFRESFNIVQANGEALLRVAVVHYTPADSAITQVEQKLRTLVTDPATGQQVTAERSIAVGQWVARGQIAVRAEVVDAATGVLLDGFAPQTAVQATQEVRNANGDTFTNVVSVGHTKP